MNVFEILATACPCRLACLFLKSILKSRHSFADVENCVIQGGGGGDFDDTVSHELSF